MLRQFAAVRNVPIAHHLVGPYPQPGSSFVAAPLFKHLFPVRDGVYAIDTIRAAAIVLVVLYHVIGSDPAAGLEIAPPHPLRSLADILNEIHMPVFAAISGLVYAMKPASWSGLLPFLWKKLLRLAVPGMVATITFAVALQFVATGFTLPSPLWHLAVYPFVHFWFLQALMVVLTHTAIADALTRGHSAWPTLLLGSAALSTGFLPGTSLMAFNGAVWLLPYFALGQLLWRYRSRVEERKGFICILAVLGIAAGLGADILQINASGGVNPHHSAPENFLLSMGVCLGIVAIPALGWIAWLAAPSFVIYLYHPLATSATRRLLAALGIEHNGIHIVLGVIAGVALPLVIYVAATQHFLGERIVLGQNDRKLNDIKLPKTYTSYCNVAHQPIPLSIRQPALLRRSRCEGEADGP
ncbi:acyltransferase family protein [Paracoccus benzoatiresistens]|uniref:Acyltransferase n=1 Tax=Paracoccus benzoatiresistens TaxID=2997341 RepID=A0ABT4J4S8_9RHOB|nr:acyltransferase [Paracoccus sp. EF6]MCZ0962098.1 acyltransferase [Paracoccus sp. EF6]